MRSIAILLCDNDFGNTFRPLLDTICRAVTEHNACDGPDFTPAQVTSLIKMALPFHYGAFQNRYSLYRQDDFAQDVAQAVKYLSRIRVLFDDEADNAFQALDHDGGSWHLHLPSGQINSF